MTTSKLRTDGDRYRTLFENSSDAHFIVDETGITDCNEATIRLLERRKIFTKRMGDTGFEPVTSAV